MSTITANQRQRSSYTPETSTQERANALFIDFRHLDLPCFSGKPDTMAAELWKSKIEKLFQVMGCTSKQFVTLVTYQLQGEVEQWWKSIVHLVDPKFVWTWEAFKDQFNRKFFPIAVRRQKANEFESLVQGEMSIADYEARFIELSHFTPHLVANDDLKVRKFEDGLCPSLRSRIRGFELSTLKGVVVKAQIFESDWNQQQSMHPSTSNQQRKRRFISESGINFQPFSSPKRPTVRYDNAARPDVRSPVLPFVPQQ
ncbi:uncharacterized protein LOC131224979 [Magnolia sinica]|uniref:uncharacterized protein LOC131224979 n=1 Tax=Magnolia sinica TaxID=86752 RepID=UPI002659B3E2|nr:uncharacterized protein LOC131224979 [Magnolia sinica]